MRNVSPLSQLGKFVIGVNDRITTFEAVALLLKYGAGVFLYRDSDVLKFHAKAYHIAAAKGQIAYVGSSNLTDPGWLNNIELNARLEGGDAAGVSKYIERLSASEFALPVGTIADAERAKDDGLLVSEREARDRREGNRVISPREPLPAERQRRRVVIAANISDDVRTLFLSLETVGFVLFEPALADVATFVTDLGLSEANRLLKVFSGVRSSGTFEINIAVGEALSSYPTFWGWPRQYAVPGGGKHSEFRPRVRLKTHLAPRDGVMTTGRLWVRSRRSNPTAELRFEIGTAEIRRTYFDSSIGKDSLVRVDRLAENIYDVTVIRPEDASYNETAALLQAASPGHHFAYF